MLQDIEQAAMHSGLQLVGLRDPWAYHEDYPHIMNFAYELELPSDEEREEFDSVGTVDGYRISQDWTVEDDVEIWEEADALDGDVVRYVSALIRELRACEQVFEIGPELTTAQRVSIVRHVEATGVVDSASLTQAAVASIAVIDAPVLMLVDPWPMAHERQSPEGKLKGRSHVRKLLDLGFVRMVGSRFVWAWNREMADNLMTESAGG